MSELTLFLIKISYLAILWIFVLSAISVVRSDMFGARMPATAREAAAPKTRRQPKQKARKGSPTHVLVVDGANKGERADLAQAPILIGRGADAAIRLDDDYVSTRHARIAASGDQWFVEDLGSTNGTYIGSARITQPTTLDARHPGPHRQDPPGAAQVTFRLQYAAISDVGRVRKDNQDSGYAGPWLLTVCDGVGGAARGDLASSTAIGQLRRLDAAARRRPRRGAPARARRRRPPPRVGQDRRPGRRGAVPQRHQHHRDRRALRRRAAGDGPRRRQPRLPLPRPRDQPAHQRPHVRAEPDRRGPDQRGGRPDPPPPQPDPQGPRRRPRRRPRPLHRRARRVRPHPALQRRRLGLARQPPARRHPVHRLPRLRRGRAGPREPRGRQHRQRHLHRRRRRARPTARTPSRPPRWWSARPPS